MNFWKNSNSRAWMFGRPDRGSFPRSRGLSGAAGRDLEKGSDDLPGVHRDWVSDEENPVDRLKKEFEPKGIRVYPISAISGRGIRELLFHVKEMLDKQEKKPVIFEQEFFPEYMLPSSDEPYTVTYDEEKSEYVVEGPRIEKMLGYTTLIPKEVLPSSRIS